MEHSVEMSVICLMLFFFHTTFHFKTALKAFILLPNVLNHRWLAECAEVASIVIELVIGNYHALQTTITSTSNSSCFDMKCAMDRDAANMQAQFLE